MKRIVLILMILAGCIAADGQVAIPGSYNSGKAPTYMTKKDSVVNATTDSFNANINEYKNSVGFQTNVEIVTGNPNGGYIQFWGSKMADPGPGTGNYYLIATDTVKNVAKQVFNHDVNLGRGNTCRWYKQVYHGVASSTCSWQSFLLIR